MVDTINKNDIRRLKTFLYRLIIHFDINEKIYFVSQLIVLEMKKQCVGDEGKK